MTSTIEFTSQCPHCSQKIEMPESMRGEEVACPTCHKTFAAGVNRERKVSYSPPSIAASDLVKGGRACIGLGVITIIFLATIDDFLGEQYGWSRSHDTKLVGYICGCTSVIFGALLLIADRLDRLIKKL